MTHYISLSLSVIPSVSDEIYSIVRVLNLRVLIMETLVNYVLRNTFLILHFAHA